LAYRAQGRRSLRSPASPAKELRTAHEMPVTEVRAWKKRLHRRSTGAFAPMQRDANPGRGTDRGDGMV